VESARPTISVIMPAYNEGQNFREAVLHTHRTFQTLGCDFELILVNDHSTDGTSEVVDALAEAYPHVQSYHHNTNLGAGAAFRTGIAHASKDFVLFAPVDSPLDPQDFELYLPRMRVCDIVVGRRTERVGYTRFARFASFTYNRIIVPLLFNIGVSDVNWIQVYRRKHFTDGTLFFHSSRIFFLVEILIRARLGQLIIAEVPAKMRRRIYGKPTCTRLSVMVGTLIEMARFFWRNRKEIVLS
jgi:glycosyltransferase involved in cell wall biosynthesis